MQDVQINNLSGSQSAAPASEPKAGGSGRTLGMILALKAMSDMVPALFQFSNELMGISTAISDLQSEMTQGWVEVTKSDQKALQQVVDSDEDPKTKNPKISYLTAVYNRDSILANQSQQAYAQLADQASLANSAAGQAVPVYLKIMQDGPEQIASILTRILQRI